MEGPRAPRDSEIPGVIRFLDSQLRPNENWSISSEYPLAFKASNFGNIRVIMDGDQVLSHAIMRPILTRAPSGLFKIATLGSVVTSVDHRHQGLSTQILDNCVIAARSHGCDIGILWTHLHDFYRRFGFELAGSEVSVELSERMPPPAGLLRFHEGSAVDPAALCRLYNQHTVGSLRTVDDFRQGLQIPNSRVYTAWDANSQLKAYAVEGKGADLNGYIHEWGGGVSALISLFSHIRSVQDRAITVILPHHAQNLLQQLKSNQGVVREGFLGMIKILHPQQLFSKLKRYSLQIGLPDLVLEHREGLYYMGVGSSLFKTDCERDVVRLLFGPMGASQIPGFDEETAKILEKVFPVSMWVWGWDSI